VPTELPLYESGSALLDSAGDGIIRLGPTTSGTVWTITNLAVSTTTSTSGSSANVSSYVIPAATRTLSNSTTLTADADLTVTLAANTTYEIEFWLIFFTNVACDLKTAWSVPAGATGLKSCVGATDNAATYTSRTDTRARVGAHSFTTSTTYQLEIGDLAQLCWERGIVTTTSTGSLTIQWAQNSAVVGNLNRSVSSFLKVTVVS